MKKKVYFMFLFNFLVLNIFIVFSKNNISHGYMANKSTVEDKIQTISIDSINSTMLYNYYYNLRENIGNNSVGGACGYVAIGMLLSFYDTYHNDDFIPETYDKKSVSEKFSKTSMSSPEISQETFSSSYTKSSLYNQVLKYSSSYFESYLIRFANENYGYYAQDGAHQINTLL